MTETVKKNLLAKIEKQKQIETQNPQKDNKKTHEKIPKKFPKWKP